MTNNFLIPKAIFLDILFDETLRQYGHEDTLFGLELAKRQVPILHIDNPLEHIGLEPVEEFLKKTEQGIENLVRLKQAGKPIQTRLLSVYERCPIWLFYDIRKNYKLIKKLITKQLKTKTPILLLFDLLKLSELSKRMM